MRSCNLRWRWHWWTRGRLARPNPFGVEVSQRNVAEEPADIVTPARRPRWRLFSAWTALAVAVLGISMAIAFNSVGSSARKSSFVVLGQVKPDAYPANLAPVAWILNGQACYGSADPSNFTNTETHLCDNLPTGWDGSQNIIWSKPHFFAAPHLLAQRAILGIGFVTGSIDSVKVTLVSGVVISAKTVPVSSSSRAYAVWLPMSSNSIGWNDITGVAGYGVSGAELATLGK